MSRPCPAPRPAAPLSPPRLRHVATIAHAAPGEARVTCTCRGLQARVDVDDPLIVRFVLTEHLRRCVEADHLLVDDARTGVLYAVTPGGQPEILLILTPPGGAR